MEERPGDFDLERGTRKGHDKQVACNFFIPQRNFWRRGWESNPRIKVLQTSPLPLGYRAANF